MHSDLADPGRTSVYFKSSPYGSYNHSHADQNSFVIHYRGRRLAIASGYYDDYGTKHWHEWYKQTRSTNAITFDGGQGQGESDKAYTGEIVKFEAGDGFDYTIGRAELAYDGKLTRAERAIVYLRPDVVVVRDSLAANAPHTWEWNIHAINRMTQVTPTSVALRNGPAQMCVEMVASPEVRFSQTDQFTARPAGGTQTQWHAHVRGNGRHRARLSSSPCCASEATVARGPPAQRRQRRRVGEATEVEVDGRTLRLATGRLASADRD
jgi:hypothetical protein